MKKDIRDARLLFIHDGKNYKNNERMLKEFKESFPELDINDIENVQCDEDSGLNQTMILKIQTARDSINGFEEKLDRVGKKHGKMAKKAFKENYVDGISQEKLADKYDLGSHAKVTYTWKEWLKTALGLDQ